MSLIESLAQTVCEAWVAYCIETGDTKPSHLMPYDQLGEWDKEADRRIAEAIIKTLIEEELIPLDRLQTWAKGRQDG